MNGPEVLKVPVATFIRRAKLSRPPQHVIQNHKVIQNNILNPEENVIQNSNKKQTETQVVSE